MKQIPVDECPAGPELDAAVAKAMGWQKITIGPGAENKLIASGRDPDNRIRVVLQFSQDIAAAWGLGEWILEHTNFESCSSYVKYDYAQFMFHVQKGSGDWPPVAYGEIYTAAGEADPDYKLNQCGITVLPLAITRAFLKANEVEYVEVADETNTG